MTGWSKLGGNKKDHPCLYKVLFVKKIIEENISTILLQKLASL